MLDLAGSLEAAPAALSVPDTAGSAWRHSFPSSDLVSASVSMFTGHRITDRVLGVTLDGRCPETVRVEGRRVVSPSWRKGLELHGDPLEGARLDHEMVEGPRWAVTVSPGTVSVRSFDPARRERTHERGVRADRAAADLGAVEVLAGREPGLPDAGGAVVTSWSAKSRARMVETLQSLDWAPMLEDGVPAMVTLTYPGDWLAVAPHAAAARRHLLLLRKRFERAYGRRILGTWKREFQGRGAPHWHLLMVPPGATSTGEAFTDWLSRTWAEVVASEWCGRACWLACDGDRSPCCERGRHRLAGTGVDYAKGARATDPKRIGVYFSKHGSYADKGYQNDVPAEWAAEGSVGRFWGVWGLSKARAGVLVHADEARLAVRILRRHSRANSYMGRVPVWRHRTVVDVDTGEVTARWRKASKSVRMYRLRNQSAGFVAVNDAPALAAGVARALDAAFRPPAVHLGRSGAGPVGFLP